ncbi:MAG: Hsp20/alpha crystallin family protein [Ideonella sp.]|nr:Hsp20/alpha crystallin family protein [Ideonella sp.]
MFVLPLTHAVRSSSPAWRRRDAADSLARVVDHLFTTVPAPRTATPAPRTPALDVSETDTHYLLSFELPGADKASLKVSVLRRRVQLETVDAGAAVATPPAGAPDEPAATHASPTEAPAAPRPLYRERLGTRYARTVSLPQEVDSDASEARFEDGVLTLRLAKRRIDGARRLVVS